MSTIIMVWEAEVTFSPCCCAQDGVPGHIVGEDGEDPGRRFGRLCRQRRELRVGGIVGEVFPFVGGVRAQGRGEAALPARLISAAAGPAGNPDFQQVSDVFNHGVRTHVMSVFQPCHKQQGPGRGNAACLSQL